MERYQRVFELPEQLFTSGSPVIIEKGVLLKDLQTGNVLLQLKFKNIAAKTVIAVKIAVHDYDVSHSRLEGIEETQYLELSASCGAFFGADRVVQMPNSNTRNVEVDVLHVVFQDHNEWEAAKDAKWTPIHIEKKPLNSILDDTKLKQYQRETTSLAEFVPVGTDDLWLCTCGHVNGNREKVCSTCFSTKSIVFSALDQNTLSTHAKAYEQNERELAAQATATKKLIIKLLIATVSVLLVTFLSVTITNIVRFSKATKLAESGSYAEAAQIFEKLGDFQGSRDKAEICALFHKGISELQSDNLTDALLYFYDIQEFCEQEGENNDEDGGGGEDEDEDEDKEASDEIVGTGERTAFANRLGANNYSIYIKAKSEQYNSYGGNVREAFELYERLPENFEDVKQQKEKIEPFVKFCDSWEDTSFRYGRTIRTRVYFTESEEPVLCIGYSSYEGTPYTYSNDGFFTRNYVSSMYEPTTITETVSVTGQTLTIAGSDGTTNTYERED